MNPSLLGAAAASVLVALWLVTRRKPRPFLRSDDTSAVAALNRAQRELVSPPPPASGVPVPAGATVSAGNHFQASPEPSAATPWVPLPAPADSRGRALLLAQLAAAAQGPLPQRIEALRTARRWGHPAALPLLRRGLRDVHPAVVREAALSLEAYRGRPLPSTTPAARPRTVSRTR